MVDVSRRGFFKAFRNAGVLATGVAVAAQVPRTERPFNSVRWQSIGNRTDLSDVIYNVEPLDVPFSAYVNGAKLDIYASDFGSIEVIPNRFTKARDA
tara:strand:- start:1588 stop:1878 length:291 start_codon:yes stop_codon:yes gene_type:complete